MDNFEREYRGADGTPEDRERKRRLLAAIGIAGLSLVTIGTLTTGALFSDSQDLGANSFTTGTVAIGLNPVSALFSVANMAPGDSVSKPLLVTNTGTLGLRYATTAVATDADGKALRTQLNFTVHSGVTAANCTAGNTVGGTVLFGPGAVGAASNIFGSVATGAQPGDQTIIAGANQQLCFVADLPLATGNAFQNAATTVTFTFAAEQTKNN